MNLPLCIKSRQSVWMVYCNNILSYTERCIDSIDRGRFYRQINHTNELCVSDLWQSRAIPRRFVFTARTTRDFMTEFLQKSRISRNVHPLGHSDIYIFNICIYMYTFNILSNIIYRARNLREFNLAALYSADRNGVPGYKLDELRSRLTPPFPHPSAKLVEFSAIFFLRGISTWSLGAICRLLFRDLL